MIKKVLLGFAVVILFFIGWFYVVGKGWLGGPWTPQPITSGPRPVIGHPEATIGASPVSGQILFGDLHTHTNYSLDAYIFNTNLVKGGGVVTTADACDFARYCSSLDFWSINDHAEGLTPRVWSDTVDSIRECNQRAGDPENPDMVSFVGWEWSHANKTGLGAHYGHKNVVFRTWEEGQTPTRPIASAPGPTLASIPPALLGMMTLQESLSSVADLGWFMEETKSTALCNDAIRADELPADCREVALTPATLFRKLDEWGFDSLVIPHGLAWGTTNPLNGDFKRQMDQHDARYQKLLELYSGHGNSELFEDFERIGVDEQGLRYCPPATERFTPCCRQAEKIVRSRCDDPVSEDCEAQVAGTVEMFLAKGAPAGRKVLPEASLDDWEGCGQLQGSFQPSSMYVPRQTGQYALALGFDTAGEPRRAKFGLIGSTDNHLARPGNGYKERNRLLSTDHKDIGKSGPGADFFKADKESGAFYYTGGLVAVHAEGRGRDAIWRALDSRNVYATSGDRMLVWFDLLNGPNGIAPMGSEVVQSEAPVFRVKALGALQQKAGCPDYARDALGDERIDSLCGGECYHPGDTRKTISRIEIVRIRPQVRPDEKIAPLVEDNWRVFDCPAEGSGCIFEFEDPDYLASGRPVLYYARVIQEAEPLIGGDPFGCERDEQGQCIKRNYCIGENATPDKDCLAEAEPRAWSSPIFLERHRR